MKQLCFGLLFLLAAFLIAPKAAAQLTSPNYQSNEYTFGAGGDTSQSSPNYQGSTAAGLLGVGQYSSSNYQAYSGFLTPNEPFLSMQITSSSAALGTLDPSSTKTATATFQVSAYLASGYQVYTMNDPPKTSVGQLLTGMASTGTSTVGTNQFGINLRANTSPATFGADPSPQPDGTFAFGEAAAGYSTVNQYRYVKGEVIADTTTTGWGQTNYTISYIANITSLATAGSYSVVQDLVAVPTY